MTTRYRLRPGALEHIKRTRNIYSDSQLAAVLGVDAKRLDQLKTGAPITPRLALHIAALQGDEDYILGYVEPMPA